MRRKVGQPFGSEHDSPDLARNTIHIRSSVIVRNLYGTWYIGILVYGSDSGYTVDRMKGIRYLVVYFAPTRSTPGGSADS